MQSVNQLHPFQHHQLNQQHASKLQTQIRVQRLRAHQLKKRLTSTRSSRTFSGLTSSLFRPVTQYLHGQNHRDNSGHQSITITSIFHHQRGFKVSSFRVWFENLLSSLSVVTSVVRIFALRLIESWNTTLHRPQSCCHTQRQEASARLTRSSASSVCVNGSSALR